jgi:hypothetical protein
MSTPKKTLAKRRKWVLVIPHAICLTLLEVDKPTTKQLAT